MRHLLRLSAVVAVGLLAGCEYTLPGDDGPPTLADLVEQREEQQVETGNGAVGYIEWRVHTSDDPGSDISCRSVWEFTGSDLPGEDCDGCLAVYALEMGNIDDACGFGEGTVPDHIIGIADAFDVPGFNFDPQEVPWAAYTDFNPGGAGALEYFWGGFEEDWSGDDFAQELFFFGRYYYPLESGNALTVRMALGVL